MTSPRHSFIFLALLFPFLLARVYGSPGHEIPEAGVVFSSTPVSVRVDLWCYCSPKITTNGGVGWGGVGWGVKLMRMISTFPSPKEESGLTKGSFVLIKVKPKEGRCVGQLLKVKVSYKDAQGKPYYYNADITLDFGGASEQGKVYSDESIRKAILLVR